MQVLNGMTEAVDSCKNSAAIICRVLYARKSSSMKAKLAQVHIKLIQFMIADENVALPN